MWLMKRMLLVICVVFASSVFVMGQDDTEDDTPNDYHSSEVTLPQTITLRETEVGSDLTVNYLKGWFGYAIDGYITLVSDTELIDGRFSPDDLSDFAYILVYHQVASAGSGESSDDLNEIFTEDVLIDTMEGYYDGAEDVGFELLHVDVIDEAFRRISIVEGNLTVEGTPLLNTIVLVVDSDANVIVLFIAYHTTAKNLREVLLEMARTSQIEYVEIPDFVPQNAIIEPPPLPNVIIPVEDFQVYDRECPFRLDFQYPSDWELVEDSSSRVIFERSISARDTQTITLEHRGTHPANQLENVIERIASAPTARYIGDITASEMPLPVHREDHELTDGSDVRWYQFILMGENFVDTIRLAFEGVGSDGAYLTDDEVLTIINTVMSNRCS
jgi:hypothetical protein